MSIDVVMEYHVVRRCVSGELVAGGISLLRYFNWKRRPPRSTSQGQGLYLHHAGGRSEPHRHVGPEAQFHRFVAVSTDLDKGPGQIGTIGPTVQKLPTSSDHAVAWP